MMAKMLSATVLLILSSAIGNGDEPKLVLLTNGQVVSGKIKKLDVNYVVIKESGSRIMFSPDKVALICSDWDDLYWQKCSMLRATDVSGHVRLFHWCVKHDLIEAAQNQIDLLQHMKISAVKLHELDQQLVEARTAIADRLKQQAEALVKQADAIISGRKDYRVMPANYQAPQAPADMATSPKLPAAESRRNVIGIPPVDQPVQAQKLPPDDHAAVDPFDPDVFNRKYVLDEPGDLHTDAAQAEKSDSANDSIDNQK